MNLTSQSSEGPNAGGYFVNFNQDCSSLAVGSGSSYHLYGVGADDALDEIYASHSGEDTWLVERLFSSSLVAVVTLSAPRKLKVCHFRKGTEICNYSYSNTILAVKLNRARLIVCLEESLYIHNIRDMKVLHTIRDTPPNPHGLCTLSASTENCYLAYPGSSTVGEVQIFDAVNLSSKTMIPAHESPLAALAFCSSGARLATASEKGTVIRVFSVSDGRKLFEFRRGVKRCVSISCLAFSTCELYLGCSSNTETVHVFKLTNPTKEIPRSAEDDPTGVTTLPPSSDSVLTPSSANAANAGWMGWVADMVRGSAGYLPTQVADVLSQGRAFASARLPRSGLRSAIAITTIHKTLRLLVATADGYLYVYSLDSLEGGECTLVKQHRLAGVTASAKEPTNPTAATAINKGVTNSYAGVLRGRDPAHMTDSEKFHEMAAATESPPRGGFKFDDDKEFPPMQQPASVD